MKHFLVIFFLFHTGNVLSQLQNKAVYKTITADLKSIKGPKSKVYQECVGAGRAGEGLRAVWQQQLTLAQKEIGFKYIRFHGLLSDDMHVYTEDANGNAVYNFQYVDHLYDFLLSIQVRPFVELGFMPPALASNEKTVFWWKGNISPPKSYEKWAALVTALVKHWEERYGKEEVSKWYFEVWNEPNLKEFYSGDRNEYFKMYDITAKAIKSISPAYRVGGPATSGSTWIKESLEHFDGIKDLVDFISTHAYGTRSVFDEFGKRRTQMREADGIPIAVRKLKADVDASTMHGREIHITEWNSSPNPKDPLHDTYQNASYVLNTLKKTDSLVTSMSYWTFTDIFEEAGPPVTPFHGGFGLINLQGIKKPSYQAYDFLNQLGNTELTNKDTSSWICTDTKGNVQAMFWNYTLLSPDSSYNQQFYSRLLPAEKLGPVRLELKHVPNGKYKLQVFRIGYEYNDPYSAYLKMGAPSGLSRSQESVLKNMSNGAPTNEKIVQINNGAWAGDFELRQNDVYLIKLNRL